MPTTGQPLPEIGEKIITTDPQALFADFRQSKTYQDEFALFYKNKKPDPDVSLSEKEHVFEESNFAHATFFKFVQKGTRFKYDPNKYPLECQKLTQEHIAAARDRRNIYRERHPTPEEIEILDHQQSAAHIVEAKAFARHGVAPTEKLGRALSDLILIENGLQTFDTASIPEIKRIQGVFGFYPDRHDH